MDFSERFDLYKEGGMITDSDIEDLNAVIDLFEKDYGVKLEEENMELKVLRLLILRIIYRNLKNTQLQKNGIMKGIKMIYSSLITLRLNIYN